MLDQFKEVTNSGFGSNVNNEGERLVTKNGRFNIKKEGLSFSKRFDLFHLLINMPPLYFFCFLFLAFIAVNLIFTFVYLIIGVDGLNGITGSSNFLGAFYFSSQTLTTVGYGSISPVGNAISLVASFEAFIGLLGFAVATGLLYGRFSKPTSKILFSKNALISPYQNITGLMARVANPKNSQLIDAKAKMVYSQIETNNGTKARKFYTLDLEMNQISLFATSWTIVHPINEDSPLYNMTKSNLKEKNLELILLVSAFNETYNQQVHFRTSYKWKEIVEGAKFSSILGHNENKQSVIHLNKIDDFKKMS